MSTSSVQTGLQGLDSSEAAERLRAEGANELPRSGRRKHWRILRDVLTEPMFGMLLGAGVIYLLLGDRLEAGSAARLRVAVHCHRGHPGGAKRAGAGRVA